MAALSDLRQSVRVFAQQCPDITIDKYLIEAIRKFCRDTWYYQQTMLVNQVIDTASYLLVPSNSEEVVAIVAVDQGNVPLTPADQQEAGLVGGSLFQFEPPNYLVIYPTPTSSIANNLEVRLVLQPPESTTTVPDSIYRNHKEDIISGALSYILTLQNEAWTNPQLAGIKAAEFQSGIYVAKGKRMRGFRAGPIRMNPRRYVI